LPEEESAMNFNGGQPVLYLKTLLRFSNRLLKRNLVKSRVASYLLKIFEKLLLRPAARILLKSNTNSQISHTEFTAYLNHQASFENLNFEPFKSPPSISIFALYLPQFQPIKINDDNWGEGFSEWTNLAGSRPLFNGHVQPIIPGKLGFYDLRNRETIREQIKLAKLAGLSGFIVMIYWFEDHSVMAESLTDIAEICNDEKFYFVFEWANEPWTKRWDGLESNVILKQNKTLSYESATKLAFSVSNFLRMPYYFKFRDRPLFFIYNPGYFKNDAVSILRDAFDSCDIDVFAIGMQTFNLDSENILALGYDESCEYFPHNMDSYTVAAHRKLLPLTIDVAIESYPATVKNVTGSITRNGIPSCFPSWDNSPRRKFQGSNVYVDCYASDFGNWLEDSINRSLDREKVGLLGLVVINAWNEWGEGAVLEPSRNSGYAYLNTLNRVVKMNE